MGVNPTPQSEIIFAISIKDDDLLSAQDFTFGRAKSAPRAGLGLGEAVSLRFKNEALSRGSDTLHLTARQIKKIQRAIKNKTDVDIDMSKTQIRHARKFVKAAAAQGAGMQVKRPPSPKTRGKGMRVNPAYLRRPPPFTGSWGDQKKAFLRRRPLNRF